MAVSVSDAANNSVTNGRDRETGRFLPGNIGGGRPAGSRNKLAQAFLDDAYAEWERSGAAALAVMAQQDASGFCKLIANVLPAKLEATVTHEHQLLLDETTSFALAFRTAQRLIGGELEYQPIIEANGIEDGDE